MSRPSPVLLLALMGCVQDPRVVHVVEADTGQSIPPGTEDSGADTAPVMPLAYTVQCGGDDVQPATGDDVLSLDGCARVSPEEELYTAPNDSDDVPNDSGGTFFAPPPDAPPPPPCGFVNLVGDVGLAGPTDEPALLYCDADSDGGLHFVRWDGTAARTRMVDEGMCQPDMRSGTVLALSDDIWLGVWVAELESGDLGLSIGEFDGDGYAVTYPGEIALDQAIVRATFLVTDPPVLVAEDNDGALWSAPVDVGAANMLGGALTPLVDSARKFGSSAIPAGAHAGDALFSWCDQDYALHVAIIDPSGALTLDNLVTDSKCRWDASPSVATDGTTVALAWDDGEEGYLAFWPDFFSGGAVSDTVDLGALAWYPQVVWNGANFLSLDGLGNFGVFGVSGEQQQAWRHPYIASFPGSISDIQLMADATRFDVVFVGMDAVPIGGGHVNSFNYVEISSGAVPSGQ